jgi:hypothetical protein
MNSVYVISDQAAPFFAFSSFFSEVCLLRS